MARGGSKPGERRGGRQKGATNKATREVRAAAAASGLLPHDFLLAVCRGEVIDDYRPTFEDRMDAAKAAAPFFAPKLAAVEMKHTHKRSLADYTTDELFALAAQHLHRAGEPEAGERVLPGVH